MIFKRTEYTIRINGSIGFDAIKDNAGNPVIYFWVDGKDDICFKGEECYRLLESLQDALKEFEKHEQSNFKGAACP